MICDRIERLSQELSVALAEYVNGQFIAIVHPAGHPQGFWFRSIGATPQRRLEYAAEQYRAAVAAIDPTITEWFSLNAIDDGSPARYGIFGMRPA